MGVICILVNVAFVTLLERKILGYSQLRKGPNKVRIIGLAQPFNDAIKLFSKELVFPNISNMYQYFLAPACGLFIVLVTVSYEVRLALILIFYLVLSSTLNLFYLARINVF